MQPSSPRLRRYGHSSLQQLLVARMLGNHPLLLQLAEGSARFIGSWTTNHRVNFCRSRAAAGKYEKSTHQAAVASELGEDAKQGGRKDVQHDGLGVVRQPHTSCPIDQAEVHVLKGCSHCIFS